MGRKAQRIFPFVAWCGVAAMLLLCTGCADRVRGMSDTTVFARAGAFMAALDTGTYDYMLSRDGMCIQRNEAWSCADIPEYPDDTVYFDGYAVYLCEGKSLSDLFHADMAVVSRKRDIRVLPDFSFEPYDREAAAMCGLLQAAFAGKDIAQMRFRDGPWHSADYLYYDLNADELDAAARITGTPYGSGFVTWFFHGPGKTVSSIAVNLSQEDRDAETNVPHLYTFSLGQTEN